MLTANKARLLVNNFYYKYDLNKILEWIEFYSKRGKDYIPWGMKSIYKSITKNIEKELQLMGYKTRWFGILNISWK